MIFILLVLAFVIMLLILISSLVAGAVRKIRGREQKPNFKRGLKVKAILTLSFLVAGCASGVRDYRDSKGKWQRGGIFGESWADAKTADKAAAKFLKYLNALDVPEYYSLDISTAVTTNFQKIKNAEEEEKWDKIHWQGDDISAWKTNEGKAYRVDRHFERREQPPYKNTWGFWYEKDGCFHGEESIIDYHDRENEKNAFFKESEFVQEIAWEDLLCDGEDKKAREVLAYFLQNYDRMKTSGLFETEFKDVPMGGGYRLAIKGSKKFWDYGDENAPDGFKRIYIQEVGIWTDRFTSSFDDCFWLKYVDFDKEWNITVSWSDNLSCKSEIQKWEHEHGLGK